MAFAKDKYGFIAGSLKSKAAAMYEEGATRLAVQKTIGYALLNVLHELEVMGYTIHKKKVRVGKNRPHYEYRIGGKNEKEKKPKTDV